MKTQLSKLFQLPFLILLLAGSAACGSVDAASPVMSGNPTASIVDVSQSNNTPPSPVPSPTPPAPTPDPNPALIQIALDNAKNHCAKIKRDQLCFASGPIEGVDSDQRVLLERDDVLRDYP